MTMFLQPDNLVVPVHIMVAYGREEVQLHTLLTLHPCTLCSDTISWPLFEVLTFLFSTTFHYLSNGTGDSFTQYISWYLFVWVTGFLHNLPTQLGTKGTLALYVCVWSASHSTCFTRGENALSTN